MAEEATRRRVTREFWASHTLTDLAGRTDYWLGQQGRLTEPVVRRPGSDHYEPISYDEAFTLIAEQLRSLPTPDAAAFYTSGRTSNEAAFAYQLFVRAYGTNNLPDCSNMCHESTSVALAQTIGIGKGSVHLEDFYDTDLIIVAGQNPGTNHPRMLSALETAKKGGAKIISVNPLPEAGLMGFKNPQTPRACSSASACPTCTCRSAPTATWPCSSGSGAPSSRPGASTAPSSRSAPPASRPGPSTCAGSTSPTCSAPRD
nr:molybdopterin-dependent oxidoreductase [Quadrisphaera sp. INWT6]